MTVQQLKEIIGNFPDDMLVKIKYYEDTENPYFSEMSVEIASININVKKNVIELTYEV